MEARSRLSVQGPGWVCLGLWLLLRLLLIVEHPWHVIRMISGGIVVAFGGCNIGYSVAGGVGGESMLATQSQAAEEPASGLSGLHSPAVAVAGGLAVPRGMLVVVALAVPPPLLGEKTSPPPPPPLLGTAGCIMPL